MSESGATEGVDFTPITGRQIRWTGSDTANNAPFNITIIDDNNPEDPEYIFVTFSVLHNGVALPRRFARVTILDDDGS